MELPKTAKLIKNSINHWIDIDGSVYAIDNRNNHKPILIKKALQNVCGYRYCSIRYKDRGLISKRVHRLVAEAFIPNPNHYNVVGHKNNIKSDNNVTNLYWTTTAENTKKAFDDGLVINDKGFDDSQSHPVKMFDTKTNKLLGIFGSCCEAAKETNICLGTITRQAKYKRPARKPFYFRFVDDKDCLLNQNLIGQFDYDTDKLINTFINTGDASRQTGVNYKTILYHLSLDSKPKYKCRKTYFKYIFNNSKLDKGEETIENLVNE